MNIENEIKEIKSRLNVIAAAMEFRDGLSNELFNRADKLQKAARNSFEKDLIKQEAWHRYIAVKSEVAELETDYPEFRDRL